MLTNTIIESGGSVVNQGFFLGWLEEILLFAHNSVRYRHRLPARDTAVKNAFVSECQTKGIAEKKKKKKKRGIDLDTCLPRQASCRKFLQAKFQTKGEGRVGAFF